MKITRITTTKRGRYALFCQEEFLFSVDGETLAKSGISEGFSITDGELSRLREGSDERRAKDQALRYLSLRAYAEHELYQKLCQKYDDPTAAAAVAAMKEIDLLNDAVFATEKARGMAERGKSNAEIRRKLSALGVGQSAIDAAMEAAGPDDEAAATALVRKMYLEKLARGETERVMAALARRGFTHGDIRRAVQAVKAEIEEET